jgi:hypothetical protein
VIRRTFHVILRHALAKGIRNSDIALSVPFILFRGFAEPFYRFCFVFRHAVAAVSVAETKFVFGHEVIAGTFFDAPVSSLCFQSRIRRSTMQEVAPVFGREKFVFLIRLARWRRRFPLMK